MTTTWAMKLVRGTGWHVTAFVAAIILVGPFGIMLAASLQESRAWFATPWDWLPTKPTLKNYELIFSRSRVLRWTLNSLVIATVPVAISAIVSVLAGYIFARKQFPGRELLFWTMLSSIMIPFHVTLIPLYLMMKGIGWLDTYAVLIVPGLVNVTGIFLMRQFMQTIPDSLEEAAELDGCTPWQIVLHVITPLCKPAVATLITVGFISGWNSFIFPLIFTSSDRMRPLTVGLSTFSETSTSFGLNMAAATINFFPTFLIYLIFQRYFVQGIALGGMKL